MTVLTAEMQPGDDTAFGSLVVLGYPDIAQAANHVPHRQLPPAAGLEGLDDVLISLEREEHLGGAALDKLPEGSGWLMIQFGGDTEEEAKERAQSLIDVVAVRAAMHPRPHVAYLEDPAVEDNLWSIRELGLGATAYPPDRHETHEGWEDSAVPPERLGDYLRDFRTLLARHDYHGASCTAIRPGLRPQPHPASSCAPRRASRTTGRSRGGGRLVVSYGGSLSGEHGDGQSRAELLPKMFGPELIRAFGEFKDVWDPDKMNPGKVVDAVPAGREPAPGAARTRREPQTSIPLPDDGGTFAPAPPRAASASASAAATRAESMCPSYRVTREEEHSTRGRARLLLEMLHGEVITGGWQIDRGPRRPRPVPGLQGLHEGVPGQRGHGHLQGGVPVPPLRGPDQARGPLLDGLAAGAGPPGDRRARPGRNGEPVRPYSGSFFFGQTGRGN